MGVASALSGCHAGRGSRWRSAVAAIGLVLAPWPAGAPTGTAPVAVLVERRASPYLQAATGFRQGFPNPELLDLIQLNGDPRELHVRLEALRKSKPRLVVAIGTPVARAVHQQLPGVPLLYCLALDPEQNQLVGRDIGGVSMEIPVAQQLDWIQKALPQVRSIGVIYNQPTSGKLVGEARRHLKRGVYLVPRDAPTPQRAAQLIDELLGRVDAFWLLLDGVIANPANFPRLVEASWRYKVALIAPGTAFVEAGALMSVGPDYLKAGQQAGRLAQEVLEGRARLENFAAEPPRDTLLTINTQVARRLDLTFPPNLPADYLSPPRRDERMAR